MQHFTGFSAATQSLLVMGHQFCDLAEDMTQCYFPYQSVLISNCSEVFRPIWVNQRGNSVLLQKVKFTGCKTSMKK